MSVTTGLRLTNTLTREKAPFQPIDPTNVRMYACGPTVYDYAHIGNARPVIVFDVLFRLLRHLYGENHVTYVRNITDVDDKINKRAFERWTKTRSLNDEIRELTRVTADQFHKDIAALGVLPPTHEPRATEFVCNGAQPLDMVRLIEGLIARGHAYAAEGHVLFHVPSMPAYGRLSRRSMDDMIAGARVEVAPYKKDATDFVLWKPSDRDTEPGWDSPWGYGRPGWHIECSAMSGALLGEVFDIHAGGLDLIFPHHENEIAQTCCFTGNEVMANVWLHNGFLQVEGQKMSKSLGNFITIHDLLDTDTFGGSKWPGEVLRLAMLKTHYRQPIDWTVNSLKSARARYYSYSSELGRIPSGRLDIPSFQDGISILCDDLNTPEFFALIDAMFRSSSANVLRSARRLLDIVGFSNKKFYDDNKLYRMMDRFLINLNSIEFDKLNTVRNSIIHSSDTKFKNFLPFLDQALINAEVNYVTPRERWERRWIEKHIAARLAARAAKNWAESDRIRDELAAMGIALKDGKGPDGQPVTTWEVKR